MKNITMILMAIACLFAFTVKAEELDIKSKTAKTMVDDAVLLVQSDGLAKALKVIDAPGKFREGEFYVWVNETASGKFLAHPKLMGKSLLDVKSPDGKLELGKELTKTAVKGTLWYEYQWPNPTTNKVGDKKTYVIRLKGKNKDDGKAYDLIFACGFYK